MFNSADDVAIHGSSFYKTQTSGGFDYYFYNEEQSYVSGTTLQVEKDEVEDVWEGGILGNSIYEALALASDDVKSRIKQVLGILSDSLVLRVSRIETVLNSKLNYSYLG